MDYDGVNHTGTGDYTIENNLICMKTHPHGAITDDDAFCYNYTFSLDNTVVTLSAKELPTVVLTKI